MKKINIAVVQPLLPSYRVPLFNALSFEFVTTIYHDYPTSDQGFSPSHHKYRFTSIYSPWKSWKGLYVNHILLRLILASPHDILILNNNIRQIYLLLIAIFKPSPLILWGHGAGKHSFMLIKLIRLFLILRCDSYIVYTQRCYKSMLSLLDILPSNLREPLRRKIFVANNCIDTNPFIDYFDAPTKRLLIANKIRLLSNCVEFVYIGRLSLDKELDTILQFLRVLRSNGIVSRIKFVGTGPASTLLKKLFFKNKLDAQFYHGSDDPDYLIRITSSSHFFLHPSSVGLGLVTAFSLGLPCLISNSHSHGPEIAYANPTVNSLLTNFSASTPDPSLLSAIHDANYYQKLVYSSFESITPAGSNNLSIQSMTEIFKSAISFALIK